MQLNLNDDQLSRFITGIKKKLIKSGDQDGNCAFYSIVNSLHYLKTGEVKTFTNENEAEIEEEVLDIIKRYKTKLRYCKTSIALKYLEELNNDLASTGIYINLFNLNKKCRYVYSNWTKTKARLNKHSVKKIPISMVETVLLGTHKTRTSNDIRLLTSKGRVINLVAVPSQGSNEIDVTFIKDVSDLVKIVALSSRSKSGKDLNRSFICEQCMTIQAKKEQYVRHIEHCNGPSSYSYKFDRTTITSFSTVSKWLPHPITVYYDLETTSGQSNIPMKTISYVYCVSFSEDLRTKYPELKNTYEYRCLDQEPAELTEYHLPEIIMRFVTPTDLKLLKNSTSNIQSAVPNSMERHCALEVYLVIKWSTEMLKKVLLPVNMLLSFNQIRAFRRENPLTTHQQKVRDM